MTFIKTTNPSNPSIPREAKGFSGRWYQSGHDLARVFKCEVGWGAVVYNGVEEEEQEGVYVAGVGHWMLGSHASEAKAAKAASEFLELQGVPRMTTLADIDAARTARRFQAKGRPRAIRAKAQPGKHKDTVTGSLF